MRDPLEDDFGDLDLKNPEFVEFLKTRMSGIVEPSEKDMEEANSYGLSEKSEYAYAMVLCLQRLWKEWKASQN